MKKVYYNFLIFSTLFLFLFFVSTTNTFAQSKKAKNIMKTLESATMLAEKGYAANNENGDANLLLDAVEVLLKNEHFKKLNYKSVPSKEQKYENLLDIDELLKNAGVFVIKDDDKTKKRLQKVKSKYEKRKDVYMSLGIGDITTTAYHINGNGKDIHEITCIKKTAIFIKKQRGVNVFIEGIKPESDKYIFYCEAENDCFLKIKNNNPTAIKILIYEEEL